MRFGVVVFPGSNCDHDCYHVLKHVLGQQVEFVWHKETDVSRFDCLILPGGFSYGDYLRAGAIARFSPVMAAVERFAGSGGLVFGICNGFQILVESGILPGAFMRNISLKFICRDVYVRVENVHTPFTRLTEPGQVLRMPIAHADGNFFADEATLARMEAQGRIAFRYCAPDGTVSPVWNPNGAVGNIAGICNEAGNVLGMMPHPERCSEAVLGNEDGRVLFVSMIESLVKAGDEPALR